MPNLMILTLSEVEARTMAMPDGPDPDAAWTAAGGFHKIARMTRLAQRSARSF
jgi:hypothetical protein